MGLILRKILTLFSWCLRVFPYGLLMKFGALIGLTLFYVFRFRRTLVLENLELAFSGSHSADQIRELALNNYKHYGCALVDFLLSISWKKKDYLQKVKLVGFENIENAMGQGKGVFYVSCHLGSWELAVGVSAAAGIPFDVVVKHARSKAAEDFLQWYRRKTGAGVFLESNTHYDILGSISKGRGVAFIFDQFMGPPIGLPVNFFGKVAGTAASLALMMERRSAPAILGYCYRDPKEGLCTAYEPIHFPELSRDRTKRLYERTQIVNDALERVIRKYPDQWLWLHRRWKPFRGKARWQFKPVLAVLAFGVFLLTGSGCGSMETSKTGIDIPPEPSVVIPRKFEEAEEKIDASEVINEDVQSIEHARKMGIVVKSEDNSSTFVKRENKSKVEKTKKNIKKIKKKSQVSKTQEFAFKKMSVDKIPFKIGERVEIALHWMALPAGKGTMEVRKGEDFNGRKTLHLWGNVLSSRLVDTIYHVDNTIESYVDSEGIIPYKFFLHMVESKQLKETRVVFDHVKKNAHYWSKRISKRWGDETIEKVDAFVPMAQDMFSGLFYMRTIDYKLNKTEKFLVYEKGQNLEVKLTPVANELITTKVGVFQAWKIDLEIYLNNVLKQAGKSYIWISDDANKFIVKFDAKLKFGSLRGTLMSLKEQ